MRELLQQKEADMFLDEITTKYQQACVKAVEASIRQVAAKHDINELVDQGSFENAKGVIKDNLFWVKSCGFEGGDYVADALDDN